jgi:hypothetical protein
MLRSVFSERIRSKWFSPVCEARHGIAQFCCKVLPTVENDREKFNRASGGNARFMLEAAMPIETVPSWHCKSLPPTTDRILLNWYPYFSDRASMMAKDSGFKPLTVSLRARVELFVACFWTPKRLDTKMRMI